MIPLAPQLKTRELAAEMRRASGLMTGPDIAELESHGVPPSEIEIHQMVGLARIARVIDSELYEPNRSGALAFITPVLIEQPASPESRWPEGYVRYGNLVDLCAWGPETPRQWRLRAGYADWLGCVRPQYIAPEPVRILRSVLGWFQNHCNGLVVLRRDPGIAYSLMMSFSGGIGAEDDMHAAELKRIIERPWPLPRIFSRPFSTAETWADAAE
jgi:hypothetical protein